MDYLEHDGLRAALIILAIPVFLSWILYHSPKEIDRFWEAQKTVGPSTKGLRSSVAAVARSLFQTRDWVFEGYQQASSRNHATQIIRPLF